MYRATYAIVLIDSSENYFVSYETANVCRAGLARFCYSGLLFILWQTVDRLEGKSLEVAIISH
jgi:hypothetical protein